MTSADAPRKVFEPSFRPPRIHRRAPRWLVIPVMIAGLTFCLFALLTPHHRSINTAGELIYSSVSTSTGHSQIWAANTDGKFRHRLTTSMADERSPAWSSDGTLISFIRQPSGLQPQLYLADADGKNAVQITQTTGAKSQPRFAPKSNTLIGIISAGALFAMNLQTNESQRLLPPLGTAGLSSAEDSLTDNTVPITVDSFAWSTAIDSDIALAAVEDRGGSKALVIVPSLANSGNAPKDATSESRPLPTADEMSIAWSPDGLQLAVAMTGIQGLANNREASGVILFDSHGNPASGGAIAVINTDKAGPRDPVYSPDGKLVVFELWRESGGAHERSVGLYTAQSTSRAGLRLLYPGQATSPAFTHDGKTVFFLLTRKDGGHNLCKVQIDGSSFVRISDGKSDITSYSLSPQPMIKAL